MHLLLALRKDRILGMISWTLTRELYSADTCVYISDLSVDCAARCQGIGAALMAQVKARAHTHGAQKLSLEVWHRGLTAGRLYSWIRTELGRYAGFQL